MADNKKRRDVCSAIAHILQKERCERGLSLSAVAERAGLSYQMVGFVEKQKRNPTLDTLLRICDAMDIEFGDVLRRASKAAKR